MKSPKTIILLSVGILQIVIVVLLLTRIYGPNVAGPTPTPTTYTPTQEFEFTQFTDEQDFAAYLTLAEQVTGDGYFGGLGRGVPMAADMAVEGFGMAEATTGAAAAPEIDRVSTTNVQVQNIDEPDIVKTNGSEIFVSPENYYRYMAPMDYDYYPQPSGTTQTIAALPPEAMKNLSSIDLSGDLLLHEDTLIVISGQTIKAYDISAPETPKEVWTSEYEEGTTYQTARLYDDQLYLILQTRIDYIEPCPISPLVRGEETLTIPCNEIFHPSVPVETDVTRVIAKIDPATGSVVERVAFTGSWESTVVYMSPQNLYTAHVERQHGYTTLYNFYTTAGAKFLSGATVERLKQLNSYDISLESKFSELTLIVNKEMEALSDDDQLKRETEMENALDDYYKEHNRELETTHISRIALTDLTIAATGSVPGQPLNQWSLDEHKDHLRIATTIGEGWWFGGSVESTNELFVLDKKLATVGSVADLGAGERIYSARFIGDVGYLVTFREIDPFYIFDLSDPTAPKKTGELKIPGYSSYLHPISDTQILGVGKEESKVKVSLFDVSDMSNPVEQDKYTLDEYWSDIIDNHRAFLQDEKHEIFFIPGTQGGYVFSYKGNKLELKKAVSKIGARRALYINDFLYVVGDDKIIALSEKDWKRVGEIKLSLDDVDYIMEEQPPGEVPEEEVIIDLESESVVSEEESGSEDATESSDTATDDSASTEESL